MIQFDIKANKFEITLEINDINWSNSITALRRLIIFNNYTSMAGRQRNKDESIFQKN